MEMTGQNSTVLTIAVGSLITAGCTNISAERGPYISFTLSAPCDGKSRTGIWLKKPNFTTSMEEVEWNPYAGCLPQLVLRIDMYVGGTTDLMEIILPHPFLSPEEKQKHVNVITQKAKDRYFPVYENVLKENGQDFLVGNRFSWADVQLLESVLMVEEKCANVLSDFPLLQDFKARISEIPAIKKFLDPGSQRKPQPDDKYVETVRAVLQMYYNVAFK
ncbi:glutathione S-transferase 3-like isoform X2 [Ascaphus truei]|uniref:glutathione S-transferase 3-like isoform X2 n=1 Tax=Ascaphus truei TaxID=8439 RepID=UPI003F59E5EF